jgi:hypothetical protein
MRVTAGRKGEREGLMLGQPAAITSDSYVLTQTILEAVKGHETTVLSALAIAWQDGAPHISCPYPNHSDDHPSWRWDERKARAFCTCIERSHSIFDVVMQVDVLEFEAAKLRVAQILGRTDLIKRGDADRIQAMDAATLLRPPADQRDDQLGRGYLTHRLGVAPDEILMPSTFVVGWRSLPYYDPPTKRGGKPKLVDHFSCVVFDTLAPDGRRHAHRIYVADGGAGKAEVGIGPDGSPRDPKKSAKLAAGQSAAGCVVLWGDPASAHHLLVAEGIETAAALAFVHRTEIEAGDIAVAAALSAGGIRAFVPWPATRKVTVAADRDEDRRPDDRGFKAGEKAARAFAQRHHERLEIRIGLPGDPGEDVDWLDVLRCAGMDAVRGGIAGARRSERAADPEAALPGADAPAAGHDAEAALGEIVTRAKADPSAPFERLALSRLVAARQDDPPAYQRTIRQLKQAGVRLRDLEREVRRASFRVIEGGPATAATDPAVQAGPYFVTSAGMIAWRKETRDGSVTIPLCNFTAQIVAEEVIDDGAERRTVPVIEGALPDSRRLPAARIPAERFNGMSWVTEAWGTAAVIFAGHGTKDHLRAAIQMLSGAVPRQMVYGHLGWRRIGDHWAFLHSGGAIHGEGALDGFEVDTGTDGFLAYELPAVP